MSFAIPLAEMSRAEKLRAMEALWADLSRDDTLESPPWHADALREAEEAVKAGAEFIDWEEAKQRLRRQAAEGQ